MGIGSTATSTQVTISGSSAIKAEVMTVVSGTRATSAGSTTLYTVPAGKQARVFFAAGFCNGVPVGGGRITANSLSLAGWYQNAAVSSSCNSFSCANPLLLTTGQTIVLVADVLSSGTVTGSAGYIEESV